MKREIYISIALMILAVGAFFYPRVQHRRFDARAQEAITEFARRMDSYRLEYRNRLNDNDEHDVVIENDPRFWLTNVMTGLAIANHRLYLENQVHLLDPFSYNHPSFNILPFGLDTDIIGVLSIPRMELMVPIYLGASPQHLNNGAAHLIHSSFPVGGLNTNAVIAGHRNMTHGRVFRDIEQLELGDEIWVANFLQTMVYEVVDIMIVAPHETDALFIQSGRDLVTLVTTHTRRRGNQRYIVVAERVS